MPVLSPPRLAHRLAFTGRQQVELAAFELPELQPHQALVRLELSLMSTGTENIVFNRNFDPGTHWDNWVKYPFFPGYSAVGVVEEIGAEVTTLQPGDRVACRCTHTSHAVLPADGCVPIPASVPSEQAVWFALAKITFHGAQAAAYTLGDSVLIIGAGPIGQMSVRWARAAGVASILISDLVEGRLALARSGGATATITTPIAEARDAVLAANGGRLPRVVIDSTGHAAVFAAALGLADRFGTVVVLGDTGQPAQQALTGDVITRGLRIVGAHDAHNTPTWNAATITRLFLSLVADGRFDLHGLTSHRFAPQDCAAAYGIANRDRAATMGILFDWTLLA